MKTTIILNVIVSLCLVVFVSSQTIDLVLTAHNDARAQKGVSPIVYNASIALLAQNYSTNCVYQHSGRDDYGENIAAYTPGLTEVSGALRGWIDNEYGNYNCTQDVIPNCTGGGGNPNADGQCDHYTQALWSSTTDVGCGVTYCTTNSPFGSSFPDWYFYVCNYYPEGNFDGEKPFPASQCNSIEPCSPLTLCSLADIACGSTLDDGCSDPVCNNLCGTTTDSINSITTSTTGSLSSTSSLSSSSSSSTTTGLPPTTTAGLSLTTTTGVHTVTTTSHSTTTSGHGSTTTTAGHATTSSHASTTTSSHSSTSASSHTPTTTTSGHASTTTSHATTSSHASTTTSGHASTSTGSHSSTTTTSGHASTTTSGHSSTTGSPVCSVSLNESITYTSTSGTVFLDVINTGTLSLTQFTISISGTVTSTTNLVSQGSGSYSLISSAFPIVAGTQYDSAQFSYSGSSFPTIQITDIAC